MRILSLYLNALLLKGQARQVLPVKHYRVTALRFHSVKSPYEMLEIREDASKEDIKEAFRKLAKIYHPDVGGTSASVEKFNRYAEAYKLLMNDDGEKGNQSRKTTRNKRKAARSAFDSETYWSKEGEESISKRNEDARRLWEPNLQKSQQFWDAYHQRHSLYPPDETWAKCREAASKMGLESSHKPSDTFTDASRLNVTANKQKYGPGWRYQINRNPSRRTWGNIIGSEPIGSPKTWSVNESKVGYKVSDTVYERKGGNWQGVGHRWNRYQSNRTKIMRLLVTLLLVTTLINVWLGFKRPKTETSTKNANENNT